LVNAGRDYASRLLGDVSLATRPAADYLALSEDATAPAQTDTSLTAEITAAANVGLSRSEATFAHTTAATTYTLTKTFTSSVGSPAATIRKVAVLNAVTAGVMVFESLLASPPTLQPGDSLTITETVSVVCP